ncbi:MAG TPA: GGDEF domain-containing protein [Burkholderiales bacterium]|nr:GGDEF domain-containing protein [Burkholderiales bacterium]
MSIPPAPSDHHDPLTALPNRRLLDDRLRQALHLAQRRDTGVALMLIEVGEFGRVADDELVAAARGLSLCLRKADTLARWGAAQFAAVITDVKREADCRPVIDRVLHALQLDVVIGVSHFPTDAGDAEALVRNADAACGRARQSGRRQYRFYAR